MNSLADSGNILTVSLARSIMHANGTHRLSACLGKNYHTKSDASISVKHLPSKPCLCRNVSGRCKLLGALAPNASREPMLGTCNTQCLAARSESGNANTLKGLCKAKEVGLRMRTQYLSAEHKHSRRKR